MNSLLPLIRRTRQALALASITLSILAGCRGPGVSKDRSTASPQVEASPAPGVSTPLIIAATSGDSARVRELLDGGAPVNQPGNTGVTPLMVASGMGHLEVVNMLLDRGADVNAKTPGGYTALMSAALNGRRVIVEKLLEKGADADQKDISNRTAQDYATSQNHSDIVELLRKPRRP